MKTGRQRGTEEEILPSLFLVVWHAWREGAEIRGEEGERVSFWFFSDDRRMVFGNFTCELWEGEVCFVYVLLQESRYLHEGNFVHRLCSITQHPSPSVWSSSKERNCNLVTRSYLYLKKEKLCRQRKRFKFLLLLKFDELRSTCNKNV